MEFEKLEKQVRLLVSQNQLKESIELLSSYFKDDADLDEVLIQSSKYHALTEKQRAGTIDPLKLEIELNKLRSGILQLLRSKEEYLKYKKLTFGKSASGEVSDTPEEIKVFFSVGSPHNDSQQKYINELVNYFQEKGIKLETLKDWNDEDPILPIVQELKESSGCLVLALERYYVNEGVDKRGSEQESKIKNTCYTSPWLHIETAIARSLDIPLMILKDKSLRNEGLIHDDKQEWGIVRIDERNMGEIFEYPIKNFILNWVKQVEKYNAKKEDNL